jgi:hypothetical protein
MFAWSRAAVDLSGGSSCFVRQVRCWAVVGYRGGDNRALLVCPMLDQPFAKFRGAVCMYQIDLALQLVL